MSSYFESEEILKSYDAALMRRLLRYLRPYLGIFLLSIAALLLGTAGELALPIIIQRTVDSYILPYHRALSLQGLPPAQRAKLGKLDSALDIGGVQYLPASRLGALSGREKQVLRASGRLEEANFLVVRGYSRDEAVKGLIARHPGLFHAGERAAAISEQDFRTLAPQERRLLRKADYQGLRSAAMAFLGALLGVLLFTFGQTYLQGFVGQLIMKDLRTELFDHTIGLSLGYLDSQPVGRLVSRLTNDVETINDLFTNVLPSLLKDFSMMAGVLVALFLLSPRLGLVTLATLPPVFILTLIFRNRARNAFRRVRLAVSKLNSFLAEHISGVRVVQLFVQERLSGGQFRDNNGELLSANLNEMYLFATFRPLVDLLSSTSLAVIVYFGGRFLLRDLISLGTLIAFINLIRMFYEPLMDLSEKYNILQSAMAGAERVFHLLDTEARIPEPAAPVAIGKVRGRIEFDRVSFAYKPGEPVLKDLSFTVEAGETVAIVGYTGAGKTTITSLLTRMWDVQEGAIRLDGVDIRDLSTQVLRRRVQSVLQDVFLFSSTIEDNIRLGSDIQDGEVERAARVVRADTFIERYPERYKTVLQERGGNLSMGQRQLLSFARVLAHDPDVLVLDEATGAIDTETEKLIQEALARLLRGRTSLVIAHRLSTIRHADRILVLDQGELLESGTHDELMDKKGMYYNLYQMQFLDRETA
jgi:ATP-binding cassette subfamily B multidrug efflux pump